MSIALVQQVATRFAIGGNPKTITISAPAAGSSLRMMITHVPSQTISGITGGGVTWSKLATIDNSNGSHSCDLWGGDNSSGSGTTISVTVSNAYGTYDSNFSEWSGTDTTPVTDPTASTNTGTSNTGTSSTVTPTSGKEVLLLACVATASLVTNTPSTGFTALTRPSAATNRGFSYQIVASASGTYQCTWPLSASYNPWATIIAGWDGASGGGGGLPGLGDYYRKLLAA